MQQIIEKIIRGGGDILLRHFGKTTSGDDKQWKGDTESDADRETEAHLVAALKHAFPGDAIMTEEHPDYGVIMNDRLWIIDSLDGSRNFVRGNPLFGISIALIDGNQVVFGMVYFPIFRELFWATRGGGAFCNAQAIQVSREKYLENVMMPFMPVYQLCDRERIFAMHKKLVHYKIWQFNPGNLILPFCYTACGRLEGSIFMGVRVWDVAASVLITEEAGGVVTDLEGKPWRWRSDPQDIIAANPILHEKMMREIIQ